MERIFSCDNEGTLHYPGKILTHNKTKLMKVKSAKEEGVCFAMSLLWIKRSIQLGEVKTIESVGNQATFEMVQAAYEKGARGGRPEAEFGSDLARMTRIIKAQNLEQLDYKKSSSMRSILKHMRKKAGFYLAGIGKPGEGGHALAFKIAESGSYFFDANLGSVKFGSSEELSDWVYGFLFKGASGQCKQADVPEFNLPVYPEFTGSNAYREAILVKLL